MLSYSQYDTNLNKKNRVKMMIERNSENIVENIWEFDKNGKLVTDIRYSFGITITNYNNFGQEETVTFFSQFPYEVSFYKCIYNNKHKLIEIYKNDTLFEKILYDKNDLQKEHIRYGKLKMHTTTEYLKNERKQIVTFVGENRTDIFYYDKKKRIKKREIIYDNERSLYTKYIYKNDLLIRRSDWKSEIQTSETHYIYNNKKKEIEQRVYKIENGVKILEYSNKKEYLENGLIKEEFSFNYSENQSWSPNYNYIYF
jgi:3-phenylpropionate/cinnamic acid dioxygenase small subunit